MRLSDWLSCEVIGSFLRQFPQKHRVEAARCACRIGVLCLWGWTTSQKQWSLEDLLEVTASINPNGSNGVRPPSPRAEARRSAAQEVVTQPWAAPRAPQAPQADGRAPSDPSMSMPAWATGQPTSCQHQPGAYYRRFSSSRQGSEEALQNQRAMRSPATSSRVPVRTAGSANLLRRRGTSQDSGPPSSAPSAKDLHMRPDGSASSLPEAPRRPAQTARPVVTTFTTARRGTVPTVPRARVQRMGAQGSPTVRGRVEGAKTSVPVSRERGSSPSGSPGTPRTSTEPQNGTTAGRVCAPSPGALRGAVGIQRVSTTMKRPSLGGTAPGAYMLQPRRAL